MKDTSVTLTSWSPATSDQRPPPASVGELTANFTLEERLILYEYTLKNASPVATPPELIPMESESSESQPRELSGLELKKAMRDFKRRRQAYRTKVSTKNKSQVEVTREIIHNMMGLLGMEEPESGTVGIPNQQHLSSSLMDGRSSNISCKRGELITSAQTSLSNSFPEEDFACTKYQEKIHKRNEPDYDYRSRSPRESSKYDRKNRSHDTSRFLPKDERKHRKGAKKNRDRTPDKPNSKYRDQNRDYRREKYIDESEYKEHEHRKMNMNNRDKYEDEKKHVRYESSTYKSHKRKQDEKKRKRDEF